jgi:hypothetical protein
MTIETFGFGWLGNVRVPNGSVSRVIFGFDLSLMELE